MTDRRDDRPATDAPDATDGRETVDRRVVVERDAGLHARPARDVVTTTAEFDADVTVAFGEESARAASLLELTALGAARGDEVAVSATGPDAAAAVEAVAAALSKGDEP
ncbi:MULTISPECIES: HPr family phosphocarrier protein [Halorussus]|uniref:HPr family phosphocarrier protein n=1 Tax=Halorussus TaxID=1070314 RepID=UPI00209F9A5F|nr:HPr family phosphocarrier protein [Halorussus vallis]USZ77475.1 HPr family phosphocarrier protein [Halorussus vallis]